VASLAIGGFACCPAAAGGIFAVSNLTIEPSPATPGEEVTITLNVKNVGEAAGTCPVTLSVAGEEVATEDIDLDAGETGTVTFTLTKDAGTYDIEVVGLTATLTVTTEEVTPPAGPTWSVGDTWVYLATYPGQEDSTYTITVTGEETAAGIACYYATIDIDPEAERAITVPIVTTATVKSGELWISKSTMDWIKMWAEMVAMGMTTETTITYEYTGAHGWPFEVDKTWTYDKVTEALVPVPTVTATVVVEAIEDVTVPAGTFSCYHIVHSAEGNIVFEEWWSGDVKSDVKIIDYATFADPETRELSSYTVAE
jgi:hypothetical protein